MRKSYDFSDAKPNPYAKQLEKQLRQQLTIRVDADTLAYFKGLAVEFAIPHQTLMRMYLRECASAGLRPTWQIMKSTAKKMGSTAARKSSKRQTR